MKTTQVVTDITGKPIGVIHRDGEKATVTDWSGKLLGTADKNGTRDATGKPLYPQNVPEMLLKK